MKDKGVFFFLIHSTYWQVFPQICLSVMPTCFWPTCTSDGINVPYLQSSSVQTECLWYACWPEIRADTCILSVLQHRTQTHQAPASPNPAELCRTFVLGLYPKANKHVCQGLFLSSVLLSLARLFCSTKNVFTIFGNLVVRFFFCLFFFLADRLRLAQFLNLVTVKYSFSALRWSFFFLNLMC